MLIGLSACAAACERLRRRIVSDALRFATIDEAINSVQSSVALLRTTGVRSLRTHQQFDRAVNRPARVDVAHAERKLPRHHAVRRSARQVAQRRQQRRAAQQPTPPQRPNRSSVPHGRLDMLRSAAQRSSERSRNVRRSSAALKSYCPFVCAESAQRSAAAPPFALPVADECTPHRTALPFALERYAKARTGPECQLSMRL